MGFLKGSAKLFWNWTKPILDLALKREPRFSSGRIDKFYKFTPPRVRRRKERKRIEMERRNWRLKMLTVEKEDPVMVTEAIIDDNRNNEMHSCLELDDDRNEMMPFSLELNDSNEKMHSCPEEMEGITSPLEVMNTNDQPTDQLKEEIQEVFIGSPIDNTRLEPLNAASREMHNKVVKDIGLKCLPSDSPEDHK